MRRISCLLILTLLALAVFSCTAALADGESWNCPNCGQTGNTGNFCPQCGQARPVVAWTCRVCGFIGNKGNFCENCGAARPTQNVIYPVQTQAPQPFQPYSTPLPVIQGQNASLLMRLATRTGPSTSYDEPGTFFTNTWQNTSVTVYTKSLDGTVWWLQVEFTNGGQLYRAYTGLQRVNIDISTVQEEQFLYSGRLLYEADAYHGPGTYYARMKNSVPSGTRVSVWNTENDFVQVDFFDARMNCQRRAWVPAAAVQID